MADIFWEVRILSEPTLCIEQKNHMSTNVITKAVLQLPFRLRSHFEELQWVAQHLFHPSIPLISAVHLAHAREQWLFTNHQTHMAMYVPELWPYRGTLQEPWRRNLLALASISIGLQSYSISGLKAFFKFTILFLQAFFAILRAFLRHFRDSYPLFAGFL